MLSTLEERIQMEKKSHGAMDLVRYVVYFTTIYSDKNLFNCGFKYLE